MDTVESATPLGSILEKVHFVLKWKYNLKYVTEENKEYKKTNFLYKNGDFNKLCEILNSNNWEEKYSNKSLQD